MQFVFRLVALLLLALTIAIGYVGYTGYNFLHLQPEEKGRMLYYDVTPGRSMAQVAKELKALNLITNATYFTFLARFYHYDQKLKAGRFALNTAWLPDRVLDTLVNGKPVLYRVTLPEGLTLWQTAEVLASKGFVQKEAFLEVVQDQAFLTHHAIPFKNAEGFLMPDTYLLKKQDQVAESEQKAQDNKAKGNMEGEESKAEVKPLNDPKAKLVPKELQEKNLNYRQAWNIASRLVDNFWKKAKPLWPMQKRPLPDTLKTFVILASIVEKETGVGFERARVAGVYHNRMRRNMLLQADPTVIYGLGPNFKGKLLYRHLDDQKNSYNTYQHVGLPPGPICSFGSLALKAAIQPENHRYLYFVAKGRGGEHVFSTTLEEHNRAVQQYRKAMREQKK